MKLAWFRATPPHASLDDIAALIAELRATHEIAIFTAANAHDFVWMHFRVPFDVCIHELDDTAAHHFIWPYVFHYSGVLLLRTLSLSESRADGLGSQGRAADYHTEITFNRGWSMLRAPVLAARLAIVPHAISATALQDEYPDAHVRYAPTGVVDPDEPRRPVERAEGAPTSVTFGVLARGPIEPVKRAMQRARDAGAHAALMIDRTPEDILREADVILALPWPTFGEPHTPALLAMAAGKPLVVFETGTTADWPSLDPQTWQPRGLPGPRPIVVSIDPRDEEHSLMLAIHRLAADETLRAELGASAREWWRTHATVRHAAAAWERLLTEAASLEPPARPPDWPPHLNADGTELAREILREIGSVVDFLS